MSPSDDNLLDDFPVQPAPAAAPAPTPAPAAPASDAPQPPLVATLAAAVKDLTYPSETDAPLTPFFWVDEKPVAPTPEIVAAHTKRDVGDIKGQSVAAFFKPVVTEEDWFRDAEKAETKRFQELQETVKKSLKDAKAFRIGKVEIDVYLVGVIEGGYAGLQTKVVET